MKIENKNLINTGRVLVEFWAPWCGPCNMLKPIVENFAEERDDINVYFCNVDEDHEMANEFHIMSIPTLIYMESGRIKNRKTGLVQSNALNEMVNS